MDFDRADVWGVNYRLALVEGDNLVFSVSRESNAFNHFGLEAAVDVRVRLFEGFVVNVLRILCDHAQAELVLRSTLRCVAEVLNEVLPAGAVRAGKVLVGPGRLFGRRRAARGTW